MKKLDGAGVVVTDLLGQPSRREAKLLAYMVVQSDAGSDLDDLLMPSLHRAVPFMQVEDIAMLVAQDLNFDMLGSRNVLLEENGRISEGAPRFRLRFIEKRCELRGSFHHTHASSATPKGRLDDQGEAYFLGELESHIAIGDRILRARQRGDVQLLGQAPCGRLIPHHLQQFGSRAHENDPGSSAGTGELGVLTQKTITRVDKLSPLLTRQRHDTRDVQIGSHRALALAYQVSFIGLEPMHTHPILLGVDRQSAQTELGRRAENSHGDLASIGHEELFKGFGAGAGAAGSGRAMTCR